ncbi:MAG: MscS Mechanosensitive ion channel [Bryobacterales bacterium]|jgi:small-conductance mechanosensitive channel|nr:MscS Mechanosensitive ion channel [Bryobacterales bacterium]
MIQNIAKYLIENWKQLVWPLVLFVAVLALGWLFRRVLFARLRRWAASTRTQLDDILIESLHGPFLLWVLILAINLATEYSDLPRSVTRWSGKLLLALWIISLTLALARVSGRLVRVYSARLEGALPVGTLTEVLASVTIWILGFLTLLQQVFEVDIRAILAALGVGGLAVALALQDTLSNLFAGFYVSLAGQIRIGDFIKIDAGQSGYVQDIGWRSTMLKEASGNLVLIPNNKLSQSIVTNYHLPEKKMGIAIVVPVNYNSDPSQVERALSEVASAAVGQVPGLLKEPAPSARLIPGFGDTSMDFTLACHVAEFADQFLVQDELRKRIYRRFREEGILFRSQSDQGVS